MTKVRVTRYVHCPFSAALELAEKAVSRWNGLYVTPSPPLGERVHFTAASAPDATDEVRKHDALLVAWRPQNPKMFPEFRGVVTVRPKHRGVSMQLDGQYEPPFGAAGRGFDLVLGRTIAQHTMRRFLDDLAAEISAEYRQERHHNQTA